MPDGLRLALGTLTALPVPAPRTVTRRTARDAMLLAPLAGLVLLVLPTLLVAAARPWDHPTLRFPIAVVLTVVLAAQTRAFHLDGLADTVDGLTASYDRERALEVMRTGDVGPAGGSALVLTLLLQVSCLAGLLTSTSGAVLAAVAVVSSRLALTFSCVGGRPARASGLGATVVGAVPIGAAAPVGVVVCALAAATAAGAGAAAVGGAAVVLAAVASGLVVRGLVTRRIGGVTGDVLGATVEISCAAGMFIAVVTGVWL